MSKQKVGILTHPKDCFVPSMVGESGCANLAGLNGVFVHGHGIRPRKLATLAVEFADVLAARTA